MGSTSSESEYLKRLTILYVEDDEETREQFRRFLSRIAGNIVVAKNGKEGLRAYRAHHPHIIITDIQMPDMDGLSMTHEIRKVDKSTCIIVLTAFEKIDYLKRSINEGVNKYVTKPVDGLMLRQILLECAHDLLEEESIKNAVVTDPLTGLLNRRELTHRFNKEKKASERHGAPFSIIMADIDHFKKINDTYGHNAGDRVLKEVAATLQSSIRSEDICGRWGGEEFLLILPRIDVKGAAMAAEKLRKKISALSTEWEGGNIRITISLGGCAFIPGQEMEACVAQADQALYRSKTAGRNRVTMTAVDVDDK